MRILHTSDWHLGKMLENISRLDEQIEFIDHLCDICEQEQIDLIIIAGDIYDTFNPSAKAQELFYSAVDRLNANGKRAVVVISGNHDSPDRLCAASNLAYRQGIFIVGSPNEDVAKKFGCELNKNVTNSSIRLISSGEGWLEISIEGFAHNIIIATLAYPSESRLKEVLTKSGEQEVMQKAYSQKVGEVLDLLSQKFRDDTVNIVVSHLFMLGGKESDSERTLQVGGALTVRAEKLPKNAHYIALGHLHRPQKVSGCKSPTYYSGSPLAYSFGESGYSKVVYIVDAKPCNEAVVKEKVLDCGKRLATWSVDSIEQAVQWARDGKDRNAWVDLEIKTDRVLTQDEQRTLKKLHSGIVNIRPILLDSEEEFTFDSLREGRKVDELFTDFYKSRMGIAPSDELINTLLEVLEEE